MLGLKIRIQQQVFIKTSRAVLIGINYKHRDPDTPTSNSLDPDPHFPNGLDPNLYQRVQVSMSGIQQVKHYKIIANYMECVQLETTYIPYNSSVKASKHVFIPIGEQYKTPYLGIGGGGGDRAVPAQQRTALLLLTVQICSKCTHTVCPRSSDPCYYIKLL